MDQRIQTIVSTISTLIKESREAGRQEIEASRQQVLLEVQASNALIAAAREEARLLRVELEAIKKERSELLAKIASYDAHPDVIEAKRLKKEEKKRQLEAELAKLQAEGT